MKKPAKWQIVIISAVMILTLYNILPTLIFYSRPLDKPIGERDANRLISDISQRINTIEKETLYWLNSFCRLIQASVDTIELNAQDPSLIDIKFSKKESAEKFLRFFPRANSQIAFAPMKTTLPKVGEDELSLQLKRTLPIVIAEKDQSQFFSFSYKFNREHNPTPLYKALILDRATELIRLITFDAELPQALQKFIHSSESENKITLFSNLAAKVTSLHDDFKDNPAVLQRAFKQLSLVDFGGINHPQSHLIQQLTSLKAECQKKEEDSPEKKSIEGFITLVKKHPESLKKTNPDVILSELKQEIQPNAKDRKSTLLSLHEFHPFISQILIDWDAQLLYLEPHKDLLNLPENQKNILTNALLAVVANIKRFSDEKPILEGTFIKVPLSDCPQGQSFIALKTSALAEIKANQALRTIKEEWRPVSEDLQELARSQHSMSAYQKLNTEQKQFSMISFAPASSPYQARTGFKIDSVYVIAKGLKRIAAKYEESPDSEKAKSLFFDMYNLHSLLTQQGFHLLTEDQSVLCKEFSHDFIYEAPEYFRTLIEATRENFKVQGTKRYATLELHDIKDRIRKNNAIDNAVHDELLVWRDAYRAAQQGIKGSYKYDIPKPPRSAIISNFLLSCKKYIRGDEKKVLHWGLDLSGGKTVQIELLDAANKVVTEEQDLKLGVNELYQRVNKLGVSEVAIQREGATINLDFPSSQSLSAIELVKASSMYFHVVNEKFSSPSSPFFSQANLFLQSVWNEAIATDKTASEELNALALAQMEKAKTLRKLGHQAPFDVEALEKNGLIIANPLLNPPAAAFDTSLSKIAYFRDSTLSRKHENSHPLVIVFNNFALEGSQLDDVRASYDPSKGNYLSFHVKSRSSEHSSPQKTFYSWTNKFSKTTLASSIDGQYSPGKGWRMAVLLNGSIVSAPTLDSPLQDSAMISGSFTQKEVLQLEQNLKAGSLSFTPKILSEKTISPELGSKERTHGISSTIIALILVVLCMITYYRFSGFIAAVAVCFNLLIMWATLQTLEAAISLPMIAGLILTVGMAVDANVLVFERIKEEFTLGANLGAALNAGYKKAFTAIIDSNVTTIIAGLVLLQFDSGPIKGFALTLIIGIVSSMFTALFMTKFFFSYWSSAKKAKRLRMLSVFKKQNFDFLQWQKKAFTITAAVLLLGFASFTSCRGTLFGMDFTGGYTATAQLSGNDPEKSLLQLNSALKQSGFTNKQFNLRLIDGQGTIKIFFSKSIDQKLGNKPLDLETMTIWLKSKLKSSSELLSVCSNGNILTNWSSTSGQMSDVMKNQALLGLALSLVGILLYITVRFELKYAAAAILCLAHDLLFTVAAIAIMHKLGLLIQIDLTIVAALMTIIGYSLNDTIIIFDRIREENIKSPGKNFAKLINHSLNTTLSRTIMTSGTTLLVLLPMIFMGGSTIFGFSLVMAIGVIFGTLSSLYIAAPLLLFFHKKAQLRLQTKLARLN